MSSEWMKVMLEEIARKKTEAEQAGVEEQHRARERSRVEQQPRVQARHCADEQRVLGEPQRSDDSSRGGQPEVSARCGTDRARG